MKKTTKKVAKKRDNPWQLVCGDSITLRSHVQNGSVPLFVVDPPYNQDVEYSHHKDKMPKKVFIDEYLRPRILAIYDCLTPTGTLWIAMNDENIAELKIMCQELGFTCQHHVVVYNTFGQAHTKRMARCKIHWLHLTKHKTKFTFNHQDPAVRVPSARQTVYKDKRANSRGKLPDDVWILRPQEIQEDLDDMSNMEMWSYSRVCGTFKAKIRHVPNQLNVEMVKRIVRLSSNTGDRIADCFNGTGTAGEAAISLGRFYFGMDIAPISITETEKRLKSVSAKVARGDEQLNLFKETK